MKVYSNEAKQYEFRCDACFTKIPVFYEQEHLAEIEARYQARLNGWLQSTNPKNWMMFCPDCGGYSSWIT